MLCACTRWGSFLSLHLVCPPRSSPWTIVTSSPQGERHVLTALNHCNFPRGSSIGRGEGDWTAGSLRPHPVTRPFIQDLLSAKDKQACPPDTHRLG